LLTKEEADKVPGCYKDNIMVDAGGTTITANFISEKAQCALVEVANGLWQWVEDKTIKCLDPFRNEKVGYELCFRKHIRDTDGEGYYKLRSENMGYDYPQFRTLGNDAENPKCMNVARTGELVGKEKCFPLWLGSTQKIEGVDQYLWLSKATAECTSAAGSLYTGEKCTPSLPPSVCSQALQQRILTADDANKKKPYPVDQWKCYKQWTFKVAPSQ